MKTSKSIKKIKINEKKVEIHYVLHHFTDDERVLNTEIPMKSEVKPHIDFFEAFQAVKEHVISLMELSLFKGKVDESTLKKHVVTTISFFEDDEDTKVMISINKYLSSGKCFSVTSPMISLVHEDYDKISTLSDQIELVVKEAREFIKGKNGEEQLAIKFEAA